MANALPPGPSAPRLMQGLRFAVRPVELLEDCALRYGEAFTLRLPIPREESYGYFEYGCHEGNYAMKNLLSGSRAEEKRRAEAVKRGEKIPEYVEPAGRGGRGGGRGAQ